MKRHKVGQEEMAKVLLIEPLLMVRSRFSLSPLSFFAKNVRYKIDSASCTESCTRTVVAIHGTKVCTQYSSCGCICLTMKRDRDRHRETTFSQHFQKEKKEEGRRRKAVWLSCTQCRAVRADTFHLPFVKPPFVAAFCCRRPGSNLFLIYLHQRLTLNYKILILFLIH